MNVIALVEAVSAAVGASAATAAVLRGWWSRREVRQQRAFRRAVQDIVDGALADVTTRQRDMERRQGEHLDRQDQVIAAIRAQLTTLTRPGRRP